MKNLRVLLFVSISVLMCFLVLPVQGAEKEFDDLYLLYIPGLGGPDAVEDPNEERHLVRIISKGEKTIIRRVFPDFYFQAFTGWEDVYDQKQLPGLETADINGVTIKGVIVDVPEHFFVTLKVLKKLPNVWMGEATIKCFIYSRYWGKTKSKWCLEPAPQSSVYRKMLRGLEYLKHLNESKRKIISPKLKTKDDYVTFLKEEGWPIPGSSHNWKPIEPQFKKSIAEALKNGEIIFREDDFAFSEEVKGRFDKEKPLCKIDIKVTAHGFPEREKEEMTEEKKRLKELRRKKEPPVTARSIREIAHESKEKREYSIKSMVDTASCFLRNLDYTWGELKYIPGCAFLAEHIASMPENLQDKASGWYIRDGSDDFFLDKSWEEIARIPNPVLLTACLPWIKKTAEKQVKELTEILQKEGYTLQQLEDNKIPGTARVKMGRKYDRFSVLSKHRIRTGQGEKLAETKRVKRLLDASGLSFEQIAELSMPELTTELIADIEVEELQEMLNLTPKFKEYLQVLVDGDNEDIKEIVREKKLNLSREGDREKQLVNRLVEKVIPRMILQLEQTAEKGKSSRDRVQSFYSKYVAEKDGLVWKSIVKHWDADDKAGLAKDAKALEAMLRKTLSSEPTIKEGEKVEAIFKLDKGQGKVAFRYYPSYKDIQWQMIHCGK